MEITLEELYNGKSTLIKKKQYFSTKEYIDPFIQELSKFTSTFICKVKEPTQITLDSNSKDITYNRVYIQAILPKNYWEYSNHQQVISLIYGLDCKAPVVKIFKGGLNMACLNLCVFNPEYLNTQILQPGELYDTTPIKSLLSVTDDLKVSIDKLKETYFDRDSDSMKSLLGKWVDFCIRNEYNSGFGKAKISPTMAISAYKNLILDESSEYYIPEHDQACLYTIYNSFTSLIRDDKDIINPVEKTLLLKEMFNI